MPERMGVLLVDDDAGRRGGVKRHLARGEFVVAGEADFGGEAAYMAKEAGAGVAIVAVEEPLLRSMKTIEVLASAAIPVLAISSLNDKEYLRKAMLAGARDFLSRACSAEELAEALLGVMEAERKRRALAEDGLESGHKGEIITVFSGKGGTGKSSIAANLAAALAMDPAQKQKVALVDLDFLLGDVAVMLDLVPDRTIADIGPVVDKLDPDLMRGFLTLHSSGVRVLAAPLRPEQSELAGPQLVRRALDVLGSTYDFVVVDAPRSFDDWVVVALDSASLVLLVATYELACLKSTKVCIEVMKRWRYSEDKLKLVINHANRASGFSIQEAESALDYPVFWKIPSDSAVLAPPANGRTLVQEQPHSKLAENFRGLAEAVGGARQHRKGMLSRLVSPAAAVTSLRVG